MPSKNQAAPKRQVVFLASIDWDSPWQRHQAFATNFAENGDDVFFVENTGFRTVRLADAGRIVNRLKNSVAQDRTAGGVRLVSPTILPPTSPAMKYVNGKFFVRRLLRRLKKMGLGPKPLVFAYLPTETTIQIIDALDPGLVVFDCVDYFKGHPNAPRDLEETESRLLSRADCVLTTSPFLYETQRPRHLRVYELHHGVSTAFFQDNGAHRKRTYRKLCYFGTLWSAIDYRPIEALAKAGFEISLIGHVKENLPPLPPSVRVEGHVAPHNLPAALEAYDGYLLPYADSLYNQGVIPAKTYECLATGKPVLCSPLRGLERFHDVFYVVRQPAEWVETALRLPTLETPEKSRARIELAKEHFAQAQFSKLLGIIADVQSTKAKSPARFAPRGVKTAP